MIQLNTDIVQKESENSYPQKRAAKSTFHRERDERNPKKKEESEGD